MESITNFLVDYKSTIKNLVSEAERTLKAVFKEFWERNPEVNSVTWKQYAFYHNDGDVCEFSVKSEVVFSNAIEQEDIDCIGEEMYDGDNEDIWSVGLYWGADEYKGDKANPEDVKNLTNFIKDSDMAPILELLFGSESKVIATREGYTVICISGDHD